MATRTAGGNSAFHNFHNDYAHIADPNERRRLALAEVDKAPFGWYHIRAIVVAGIGFFTDAYDIFAIGLVTAMMGIVYYGGVIPSESDTAIKISTSAGTVIGESSTTTPTAIAAQHPTCTVTNTSSHRTTWFRCSC